MKPSISASLSSLKAELQQEAKQDALERLAAALTGRILGVTVSVAQRGFQHGGDAGPAGRQERRFRLECKKYAETSPLSRRELLGEIDHALVCDEALEAWILVATRSVPEQVAQDLIQHGEKNGVPVLVWDWSDHEIGSLAALCASDPDLVETLFSNDAGRYSRDLVPFAAQPIAALRRELHSWCLGFAALRHRSHEKLQEIWDSPRASNAALLQDVAGGARPKKIRRSLVHDALSKWWVAQANTSAPAAVVGFEGVGKTWVLLGWVVECLDQQPIVLVVPSSAAAALGGVSETTARQFLANRLHEMTGVRDSSHWARRLDRLLRRPVNEGPALTVCLDGLNQEPAVPWVELLKVLQGDLFALRVRLVVTTRKSHFEEKLSQLRSLTDRAIRVPVEPYSLGSGGELEQMLALEGLRPEDLQPELIDLACRPRLFALVMRFGDRLVSAGQVNVHRLLWEYGRDTLGERAGSSFSESDWLEWLKQIAEKHREGIREFSRKSLGEMAASADLSPREVYARLSDIIDGRFASQNASGALEFTPTIVAHALGAALVARLSGLTTAGFAALESALVSWLDPISGLDQRAEVLRAAVSIIVEQGAADSDLASVLVSAWLQTQNISESHRSEIAILAPTLTRALLDAIEKSAGSARESARYWAVKSLRQTPRTSDATRSKVIDRVRRWLSVVSLDVDVRPEAAELQKRRTELLQLRIGTAAVGPVTILGVGIELVEQNRDSLHGVVASLVDGYPMIATLPVLEMAAVALAVAGRSEAWSELQWLCYFNEVDPRETSSAIRDLAKSILHRRRETGVHPELPRRIAGSLLRLTGNASDEDDAASLNTSFDLGWNYEDDYLKNPARSVFMVERRHATQVLEDPESPLHVRIQRTADLWLDPTFTPPPSLTAEVESLAAQLDVEKLDRSRGRTMEDHRFEELEPVLARCAPGLLAEIVRRKLRGMTSSTGDAQFCSSLGARCHLLLAGEQEVAAARALRLKIAATSEDDQNYAVSVLLMLEIKGLGAYAQFAALIDAGLKFILRDFLLMLRQPHPGEVDQLVSRYSNGSTIQQKNLLALLSVHAVKFQDAAWGWAEEFTKSPDPDLRGLAFKTLGSADAARFGSVLNAEGWSWQADAHLWVNHYGTLALIEATRGQPLDQILPRLAPWRLLEAARLRGEDPAEVRLAAEVFGRVLNADKLEELDPGSEISITRKDAKVHPFLYSVAPRENTKGADLAIAFKAMFDVEAQVKAHQRATETAIARIDEARARGANLLMVEMDNEDMVLVVSHAADLIDRWIDGHVVPTDDFRRRVRLAESAFLSLCEVLLARDPSRGVQLWRALRKTVATRYLGAAKVDDLIHMVFRVPQSEPVRALQRDLLSLERTSNDAALFDLALAASYNEKASWLDAAISDDLASQLSWKQRRGTVLLGFSTRNALPVEGAWPEGEIKTSHAELKRKSARLRALEACAQHWWRAYLAADSDSDAYAAWVLFLHTADRRSSVWMRNHIPTDMDELTKLKIIHADINNSEIERHSKKRADKFQGQFLGHKTAEGIGPWA